MTSRSCGLSWRCAPAAPPLRGGVCARGVRLQPGGSACKPKHTPPGPLAPFAALQATTQSITDDFVEAVLRMYEALSEVAQAREAVK